MSFYSMAKIWKLIKENERRIDELEKELKELKKAKNNGSSKQNK